MYLSRQEQKLDNMFDPLEIIKTVGLLGIFIIVFAESGLFFGFFLPGDSLLFTAGIFASQGFINIWMLIALCAIAAILGDSVGYWTGSKMGRKLFEKDAGFFFKKKRLYDAEHFYKKHGAYTLIMARFIPVIRTFAPIVAGIARMKYHTFFIYNIVGAVLWSIAVVSLGYFLGNLIPNPDTYILPIIILMVIVSSMPVAMKYFKHRIAQDE
jgi:membrane-associated protein